MKIITILNFGTGHVQIVPYPSDATDAEQFLIKKGFDTSNCQWMVTDFTHLLII